MSETPESISHQKLTEERTTPPDYYQEGKATDLMTTEY